MKDQRTFSSGDWEKIKAEETLHSNKREADMMWTLFNNLHHIKDGFDITQRDHSLIMARLAVDVVFSEYVMDLKYITADEFVLVALLHDVAKPLSLVNHPAVAAEILKHRVSNHAYLLIKHHSLFLGHTINNGKLPNNIPHYNAFLMDATKLAEYDARSVNTDMPQMTLEEAQARIYKVYGVDLGYS